MPLLGDVHQRQVQQLDRSVFIGEGAAGLDHLAQSHVQRLYGVGRVDDFSDIGRERKEGHNLFPMPAPELADRAVFGIPFGGKDLQLLLGILAADGSINHLQIGHHSLGVLPAHEAQTGPHHVHDAELHGRLRIGRLDGLREAFQTIDARNENIFHSPRLQVVEHAQPKLGALVGAGPQTQHFFVAFHGDADGHVDGAVLHRAFLPHLHHQGVQVHDRVYRIQRPVLPGPYFVQHGVGDIADERRAHLHAVHLLQVPLDVPRGHATRVHRQDFPIEPRHAGLALRDDLGLERSLPIARCDDLYFAKLPLQSFLAFSVAPVAARLRLLVMLLISQVVCHLGFQRPFHQCFRQLPQHTILAGQILRLPVVCQQPVYYFLFNRHGFSNSVGEPAFTQSVLHPRPLGRLAPNGLLGDYSRAAAVRHADLWHTDSAAGILISVAVEDLLLHDCLKLLELYLLPLPSLAPIPISDPPPSPCYSSKRRHLMPRTKQPVSDKQLAANRTNAAQSTGPRSPEGKARSALNSRKHGFTASTFAVVRLEDIDEVAHLREDAIAVY